MSERKTKKKPPTKVENLTREQLQHTLIKKRECTKRAQQIVVSLLETEISEEFFLKCLPNIDQSHFDDIAEERSILKQCGYPICTQKLPDNIPNQKYKISLRTNKVYDITVRKNYCSNGCYKAAMFIKQQILTSPLWFREEEIIPDFKLLPMDPIGILGEELDVSIVEKITSKSLYKKKHLDTFTTIATFAKLSLNEMPPENEILQNTKSLNDLSSIDKLRRTTLSNIPDVKEKNIEESDTNESTEQHIDQLAELIASKMTLTPSL